MNANVTWMQKTVKETRGRIEEEVDEIRRKSSIIIYHVPESEAMPNSERNKVDEDFCEDLMTEMFRLGSTEGDMVNAQR
jgi:hypothetical protein